MVHIVKNASSLVFMEMHFVVHSKIFIILYVYDEKES